MDHVATSPTAPVLAIDIGGTKTVAALVAGDEVTDLVRFPTDRAGSPDDWISAIAGRFPTASRRYTRVAAAVSGMIEDGRWSALNPDTLSLPPDYKLTAQLEKTFGVPAFAANDAQAAAWGEHRYGAGGREDMVFLTISTGVGGGIVINGRPLAGLAGHFGLVQSLGAGPLENEISGRWIAAQAAHRGPDISAVAVFAAADRGESWAAEIVDTSARKVARLCADIQLLLDPPRIVIGGGVGLAAGFLERIRGHVVEPNPRLRPRLHGARLGANAGLVGVADLALNASSGSSGPP